MKHFSMKMSEEDHATIATAAKAQRMSMSTYILRRVLGITEVGQVVVTPEPAPVTVTRDESIKQLIAQHTVRPAIPTTVLAEPLPDQDDESRSTYVLTDEDKRLNAEEAAKVAAKGGPMTVLEAAARGKAMNLAKKAAKEAARLAEASTAAPETKTETADEAVVRIYNSVEKLNGRPLKYG